jgi:hypothetical protein
MTPTIFEDLHSREKPLCVHLAALHSCPKSDYVGKFPLDSDYDQVIKSDCDVFVAGAKVISFRKALFPRLKEGSVKEAQTWEFFRMASREVYGTQRGVVAGNELTTRPEARLTRGQFAFFSGAAAGLVSSMEEATTTLNSSNELTVKTLKIKYIKRDFPVIAEQLKGVESEIRKHKECETSLESLREQRRTILWSWFDPWLNDVWQHSQDKVEETRKILREYISVQLSFNHCYSNVLGAIDRGARFPYGRLSGTTQRHYDKFSEYQDIYSAACEGFRFCFPETWDKVKSIISRVKDPNYNLFGTAFTSTTLNFNFKTAYHVDKNNLKGGLAVLTAMTKGSYKGHYLVFPEVRLAFDLRDGDFIVGDTQTLLHGNSPMTKLSEDAERVSLVFYSRENMTRLDSLECESCRKEFVKHSSQSLKEKSKNHKDWRGVWEGMWVSQEWLDFRKQQGLEHCSNSNWQLSSPYRNLQNNDVTLFKDNPGADWELVQVLN